ncbi:hypothetical protein ACSYOM_004416 [Vibrio alginolyticus]
MASIVIYDYAGRSGIVINIYTRLNGDIFFNNLCFFVDWIGQNALLYIVKAGHVVKVKTGEFPMNVTVKEFRNSVDHLFRMVNVDYHSCVGHQEVGYWIERTERVLATVRVLECKRAKPVDREEHAKSLESAERRLVQAKEKKQLLEARIKPSKASLTLCIN